MDFIKRHNPVPGHKQVKVRQYHSISMAARSVIQLFSLEARPEGIRKQLPHSVLLFQLSISRHQSEK
jgi:hypothetical protein